MPCTGITTLLQSRGSSQRARLRRRHAAGTELGFGPPRPLARRIQRKALRPPRFLISHTRIAIDCQRPCLCPNLRQHQARQPRARHQKLAGHHRHRPETRRQPSQQHRLHARARVRMHMLALSSFSLQREPGTQLDAAMMHTHRQPPHAGHVHLHAHPHPYHRHLRAIAHSASPTLAAPRQLCMHCQPGSELHSTQQEAQQPRARALRQPRTRVQLASDCSGRLRRGPCCCRSRGRSRSRSPASVGHGAVGGSPPQKRHQNRLPMQAPQACRHTAWPSPTGRRTAQRLCLGCCWLCHPTLHQSIIRLRTRERLLRGGVSSLGHARALCRALCRAACRAACHASYHASCHTLE
mmetsp:Transcript_20912/g.67275  ORF Transcript_20912/g.67275 Transcript_20912/m.67275 type:complete len:352 (-) Transcript_20912:65-1120(-)